MVGRDWPLSVKNDQGFNTSITYTPTSDSYQVTFFRSTSATPPLDTLPSESDKEPCPHDLIAPLLANRLNELTSNPNIAKRNSTGLKFIRLLKNTLPVLLEIERIQAADPTTEFPVLIVRSVETYRLVWDVGRAKRWVWRN